MRACHALERAMLQCTGGVRSGCSLRLTMECVPQDEMCRSRGVGMTKFQMSKADLHNKVHLCCPQPGPRSSHATAAACVAHGLCFRRVLIHALQSMTPCDVQV